jgi:uncharacterized protein with GYD domain
MPKYLYQASYTTEGVAGVRRDGGTARREAISAAAQALGGSVESFYFAFGEHDAYTIVELPDQAAAAAIALTVNASGAVKVTTTVLLEPEEIDTAAQRTVDYRAPGG